MASLSTSVGDPDGRDFLVFDGVNSFEQYILKMKKMAAAGKESGRAFDGGLSTAGVVFGDEGKCQIIQNNTISPTFIIHEAPAALAVETSLLDLYLIVLLSIVSVLLICLAFYAIYKVSKHLREEKEKERQHQVYGNPVQPQAFPQRFHFAGQPLQLQGDKQYVYFANNLFIHQSSFDRQHFAQIPLQKPAQNIEDEEEIAPDLHGPAIRPELESSRLSLPGRRLTDETAARPHHLLAIRAKPDGAPDCSVHGPAPGDRLSRSLEKTESAPPQQPREAEAAPLAKFKSSFPKIELEDQTEDRVNLERIQQLIKADTKLKKNKPIFLDCHQPPAEADNKLPKLASELEEEPPLEDGKFKKSFQEAQFIGEGSYGEVYRAIHKLDKKEYAIKKIRIRQQDLSDWTASKVFREVMAMANTQHENIVRFITCWLENGEDRPAGDLDDQSCASDSRLHSSKRSKSMDGLSLEVSKISAFQHPESGSLSRNKSSRLDHSDSGLAIHFEEEAASPWQNKACKSRRKASHNPIKFINLYIQVAVSHRRWSTAR